MRLGCIDHWYWCRYFVDVYPDCPFRCSYCNTRGRLAVRGIEAVRGLPSTRSTIGVGLISDLYHPEGVHNEAAGQLLQILLDSGHSISIQTKSSSLLGDLELLEEFSRRRAVQITLTVLTPNPELASRLEGLAPSPGERLDVVGRLVDRGIPTGVAITPIIPFLTDGFDELEDLVREAGKRGAGWVLFSGFNPPSARRIASIPELASLHLDRELLDKRYREIKAFMIGLLHDAGMPMRIPRLNPNPLASGYHNSLIGEHLFNISYYFELLDNPLQAKRYRRAAHRISDLEYPLKSVVFKKKLGYIKGINPEIEGVILDILSKGSSSFCDELLDALLTRHHHG
jgi:DNA repair photolyase